MRVPPSERWKSFGTHLHRFEPPDLYIVRIRGNVLGDDMRSQIEALRMLAKRTGGRALRSVPKDDYRNAAQWQRERRTRRGDGESAS